MSKTKYREEIKDIVLNLIQKDPKKRMNIEEVIKKLPLNDTYQKRTLKNRVEITHTSKIDEIRRDTTHTKAIKKETRISRIREQSEKEITENINETKEKK